MRSILNIVVLVVLMIGCKENISINKEKKTDYALNDYKFTTANLTKPDRHWSKCHPTKCKFPAHDCFPDIIVYPDNSQYVNELDELISINQVNLFFNENGNYEQLFPGLFGKALEDLRDNITTLRKIIVDSNTIAYRIVLINDTSLPADYYNYYMWDDTLTHCKSCDDWE